VIPRQRSGAARPSVPPRPPTPIGLVFAVTPWLLSFATDHTARLDVMAGGAIVALLGIALIYVVQPESTRRPSH
jgi:hypothetical protein